MKLVIKLFHEIVVKSKPVRKLLIKHLHYNLENAIKPIVREAKVYRQWDRIELKLPEGLDNDTWLNVKERLECTPGIDFIQRVEAHTFESLDDIIELCVEAYADQLEDKSFCVRVKRKGKHSFSSNDAERIIGGGLLAKTNVSRVELRKPDVQVNLEIIDDQVFLVREKIEGLGGYPMGQQEAAVSLISGGFDSSVSSFLMMRRGVRTHFCFFNLGGIAHEIGVKQVAYYLWNKYGVTQKVKFITVPFEGVVEEILAKVDQSLMGVVLKRMMLRAADKVAQDLGITTLVTGEAVGQVSSQTLTNLSIINLATQSLVLRPLIAMDKQDIILKAREIGTEEFSASMPEYCGVISNKPTTRAKLDKVEQTEANFDYSVLENAIASKVLLSIDKVLDGVDTDTDVEIIETPQVEDVIIDIRHPQEQEDAPLMLTNNRILKIPFYSLESRFPKLTPGVRYLLYCDKGVMSKVQAHHLKVQGFENVKVFRYR